MQGRQVGHFILSGIQCAALHLMLSYSACRELLLPAGWPAAAGCSSFSDGSAAASAGERDAMRAMPQMAQVATANMAAGAQHRIAVSQVENGRAVAISRRDGHIKARWPY